MRTCVWYSAIFASRTTALVSITFMLSMLRSVAPALEKGNDLQLRDGVGTIHLCASLEDIYHVREECPRAFAEFSTRDRTQVKPQVDAQNPHGAVALYEGVGMTHGANLRHYPPRAQPGAPRLEGPLRPAASGRRWRSWWPWG